MQLSHLMALLILQLSCFPGIRRYYTARCFNKQKKTQKADGGFKLISGVSRIILGCLFFCKKKHFTNSIKILKNICKHQSDLIFLISDRLCKKFRRLIKRLLYFLIKIKSIGIIFKGFEDLSSPHLKVYLLKYDFKA